MNNAHGVQVLVHTQNAITSFASALNARIERKHNENGEGVISAAIAVLIMATIGAVMYVSYLNLFSNSAKKTSQMVDLSTIAPVITAAA